MDTIILDTCVARRCKSSQMDGDSSGQKWNRDRQQKGDGEDSKGFLARREDLGLCEKRHLLLLQTLGGVGKA